jgi:hypothetical protein
MGIAIAFASVTLRRLHADSILVSYVALGSCISNLTTLFWAFVSTRGNKLAWTVYPTIFSRGVIIFSYFIEDPFIMTVLLFTYFFTETISIAPYSAVMREAYPDEYRSQAMGYVRSISIGATLVGAALGGRLLDMGGLYSYKWVFPLGGIFGVISSLIFMSIRLPSSKITQRIMVRQIYPVSQSIKNIITSSTLLYVFSIEFIVGLANLIGIGVYPLFQVDILKLSNSAVGLLAVIQSIGGMVFLYIWGRVNTGKVKYSSFMKIICIVPFISLFYLVAKNIYPLCLSSLLAGICWNGWDILWFNYLLQSAGDDNLGKGYVGIRYTMLGVRSLLAPVIIKLLGSDIRLSLGVATVLALSGLILLSRLNDDIVSKAFREKSPLYLSKAARKVI